MSCPGLHCPGCSSGQSAAIGVVGVVGLVVAYEAVVSVAEHIWEIGGTIVVCFALSIAISMWMERWAVVRGTRFAVARGVASQADVAALNPAGVAWLERERVRELEQAQRDALRHQRALELARASAPVIQNVIDPAALLTAAVQYQPEPVRVLRGEVER
jgi:hypothetical protein